MHAATFTWGETVQVAATAPPAFRPGQAGSVCGIRETPPGIPAPKGPGGRKGWLYLVEFGDGCSIEIPDKYLGSR